MKTEGNTHVAPLEIAETGDDSPARSIWGFVWRMTGWHQLGACVLALTVAAMNLAPIELQRRIVDDAIVDQNLSQLLWLGVIYGVVILAHRLLKFALGMYQAWLSESTILYTREHLLNIHRSRNGGEDGESRQAVSVIGAEVDKIGGFVGHGPSQACVNAAMLFGVIGYMAFVQPQIALLSLTLLVPQIVLAPMIQRRLYELVMLRQKLLRDLGGKITNSDTDSKAGMAAEAGGGAQLNDEARVVDLSHEVYANRIRFMFWKLLLKGLLNLLNALVPVSLCLHRSPEFFAWLISPARTSFMCGHSTVPMLSYLRSA